MTYLGNKQISNMYFKLKEAGSLHAEHVGRCYSPKIYVQYWEKFVVFIKFERCVRLFHCTCLM